MPHFHMNTAGFEPCGVQTAGFVLYVRIQTVKVRPIYPFDFKILSKRCQKSYHRENIKIKKKKKKRGGKKKIFKRGGYLWGGGGEQFSRKTFFIMLKLMKFFFN